jgi:hypothetical protein
MSAATVLVNEVEPVLESGLHSMLTSGNSTDWSSTSSAAVEPSELDSGIEDDNDVLSASSSKRSFRQGPRVVDVVDGARRKRPRLGDVHFGKAARHSALQKVVYSPNRRVPMNVEDDAEGTSRSPISSRMTRSMTRAKKQK